MRTKPSTKARRDGYHVLHSLRRVLMKLLYPMHHDFLSIDLHPLDSHFFAIGWSEYMVRHIPFDKRGGPDVQKPSKRKRQKQKDRKSTIR